MKNTSNSLSRSLGKNKIFSVFSARLFMLIAMLFLFSALSGQDIIKMKSGKEMKVVIVEETSDIVKYREFSDPSGPLYTVKKEFVESVVYRKGGKDTRESEVVNTVKQKPDKKQQDNFAGNPDSLWIKKRFVMQGNTALSVRNVKVLMEDNPAALALYDKGSKQLSFTNTALMGTLLVSLGVLLATSNTEDLERIRTASAVGLSIDAALITTAVFMSSAGKKKVKEAVRLYNAGLSPKPVSSLNIGTTRNGFGITFRF